MVKKQGMGAYQKWIRNTKGELTMKRGVVMNNIFVEELKWD